MSVLDAIKAQYERNKSTNSGSGSFETDFSMYFSPRLEDGEKEGESNIRFLPPVEKGGSPFEEAYWHVIQVGGTWKKLYCNKHNDGERCPLCEIEEELKSTGDESDKKLAKDFKASKFYVVRVIDRNKEEDGVKFWRFRHNYKGEGPLDKLIPIFTKKGDISDPREGRDITLMLGRDDKKNTKIVSIMAEDPSVLTDPKGENAKKWMGDKRSWKDIYKAQPMEYLELVANGETPVWDKNLSKFIAKSEAEQTKTEAEFSTKKSSSPVDKTVKKAVETKDDDDDEPF